MRSREDGNIRSEHAPIANSNKTAIKDRQVEICVEARADGDVATVVNVEGWFNENVVITNVADDGLEHFQAL
jgi:hypothetical protein